MNIIKNIAIALLILTTTYSTTLFARIPSGTILAYDNTLEQNMPIIGVQIDLHTEHQIYTTYTDTAGHFSFPSVELSSGHYQLQWKQQNSLFYITTNGDDPAGIRGGNINTPWNLTITNGESQYHSILFRAAVAYLTSDIARESKPFSSLPINANYRRKRFGGPGTARFNSIAKDIDSWAMNKYDNRFSDIRVFAYVSHELAHAHHDYIYQGRSQYLNTELRLRESWAEAVKYYQVLEMYGNSFSMTKTYSKQIPFYSGWHNHSWGRSDYYPAYTPLMIDLVDTFNQEAINDQVSGYTLREIVSVLKYEECTDFDEFKHLLKQMYSNPTEEHLDLLFSEMEEQ